MAILTLFLSILALLLIYWIYTQRSKKYTREQFAVYSSIKLFIFIGVFIAASLGDHIIPFRIFHAWLANYLDVPYFYVQPRLIDYIVVMGLLFLIMAHIRNLHKNWQGEQSERDYQNQQKQIPLSLFADILAEFKAQHHKQPLKLHVEQKPDAMPALKFQQPLEWKQQSKELLGFIFPDYQLNQAKWHDEIQAWIGEHKHTEKAVVMLCCYDWESAQSQICKLQAYLKQLPQSFDKAKYHALIRDDITESTLKYGAIICQCHSERQLLDNLIDFRDYFYQIKKQVEKDYLPDSDINLKQAYTESNYQTSSNAKPQGFIEKHLQTWLDDSSATQRALLGEYGQGKSTTSLMLCYHLIQQIEAGESKRVPILIILRGKSPRNMTPLDFLSQWCAEYNINPKALMLLQQTGRLLLILEGFDEIDMAGDRNTRLHHFRNLWQFNHKNSKILFTGRPNYFFDTHELRAALNVKDEQLQTPCQAVYLSFFESDQIADSLRYLKESDRQAILDLADNNPKFKELISRPVLLYMAAILWQAGKLADHKDNINAAVVIQGFVDYALKRQTQKQTAIKGTEREYMQLNPAERAYFMAGVAVYMVSNGLANHISSQDLENLLIKLLENMPEQALDACNDVDSIDAHHFYQRFDISKANIVTRLITEIRASGLIVTDLRQDNAFKFGHKSFMEYLVAQVYVNAKFLNTDSPQHQIAANLFNRFKLSSKHVQAVEIETFIIDLLQQQFKQQAIPQAQQPARLWDYFVAMNKSEHFAKLINWFQLKFFKSALYLQSFGLRKVTILLLLSFIGFLFVLMVDLKPETIMGAIAVAGAVVVVVVDEDVDVRVKILKLIPMLMLMLIGIDNIPQIIMLFGYCLGVYLGFAMLLLNSSINGKFAFRQKLRNWYHVCKKLQLSDTNIDHFAGKDGAKFLQTIKQVKVRIKQDEKI